MGTSYSVILKNESLVNGKMCIYQRLEKEVSNVFSLAWFSKQCNQNVSLKFAWEIEYCATWAETGVLKPKIQFTAGENRLVDPSNPANNSIGLSFEDGGYLFTDTDNKAAKGTIGIFTDDKIPNKKASIGVGMNGESAFATQALMNYNFIFTPKVRYYVVFGNYTQGTVMDLAASTQAFEIKFPDNEFERKIVLGSDNTFRYND